MSKLGYFKWPILLSVAGLGLGVFALVTLVGSFGETGTAFVAPGEITVTIKKPGGYTLWQDKRPVIDGQITEVSDELPTGTTIKILKQPEGTPVNWTTMGGTSMTLNDKERISVGEMQFDSPGQYHIAVSGFTEKRALYLDEQTFARIFFRVMFYGLTGVFLFAGGVLMGLVMLIRQSGHPKANPPPMPMAH